ncbi:MAG TPA: DUF3160 domain-containing protein [Ignavibacteriaceae bacterium]|nr:DUF3160 domain-containing protein [Ignavibacteriaceae bacterium]
MFQLKKLCFYILFTFLFHSPSFPQVFNIDDYIQFLEQHQNMSTEELLQMHPAGAFTDKINSDYNTAVYFDSIDAVYNLTDYEKSLIADHGFMVSERLKKISFGEAMLEIFNADLPVFVSTDAILHAMHISYDRILREVEIGLLKSKLIELLNSLHSSMLQLHSIYSSDPEMLTMLKDVDIYLTVPLLLLEENVSPYYPANSSIIDTVLTLIAEEQPSTTKLFSFNCRTFDWSQFKPRGHYVLDPITGISLEGYFRAMMWLGRIQLYLMKPNTYTVGCDDQTFKDIQRQAIDSFLIDELLDIAGTSTIYEKIESTLKFFIGESDNVTLDHLDYLKEAISLNNASELLDSLKMVEFQDTLEQQSFAYQLILSEILYSPLDSAGISGLSSFLLFGQRFVIDSYVTGSVVFDKISYYGEKICRLYPSTLDVLFSLGNNAAIQLLIDELNAFHYSTNLAALRYLIDHYDTEFWESSLYNYWLNSIRILNPPEDRTNLPEFMKTAAFWQEKLNTQLASWTQLRHDNLLYAKQSYTGGTLCSYPYSFVEPFPEIYNNISTYCQEAYSFFNNLDISDEYKYSILDYYTYFKQTSDTLNFISQKELNGEALNSQEALFLKKMIYSTPASYGDTLDGWYPKLFYRDYEYASHEGLMESDHLAADIHTTPTDCFGGNLGAISHVGTGNINLGVFITPNHLGELTAFVGPVNSYYEYRTMNFLRLTDDEWASTYLQSASRPEWVNIYLADSTGESRGDGTSLITNVERDTNPNIPQSEILLGNYPNPFNPYTIINFSIPFEFTNSPVELNIFDINGSLVKTLLHDNLAAGNYLVKWFSDNNNGVQVSSGVYFYSLQVGSKRVTNKMTLLK